MCLLHTVSAKGPGAVRLAVEELGRPPPPTASCLKRDEPDPLSNGRQLGVRRTHCYCGGGVGQPPAVQ